VSTGRRLNARNCHTCKKTSHIDPEATTFTELLQLMLSVLYMLPSYILKRQWTANLAKAL